MIHYIYVLIDPRDDRIRYVGKTVDIASRYRRHTIIQYSKSHYANWINKLVSLNLKPSMKVIEECDESNWEEREQYWIKHYRELKYDLVNSTNGGEGVLGYIVTEETRQKLREKQTGRKLSEEGRQKLRLASTGRKLSDNAKLKVSQSLIGNKRSLGYKHTEEAKRKITLSSTGRKHTEESKRKMSLSQKGRKVSGETKLKLSIAARGNNNPNAKLDVKKVKEIRYLLSIGKSVIDIAKKYQVSDLAIRDVKSGRCWSWVK